MNVNRVVMPGNLPADALADLKLALALHATGRCGRGVMVDGPRLNVVDGLVIGVTARANPAPNHRRSLLGNRATCRPRRASPLPRSTQAIAQTRCLRQTRFTGTGTRTRKRYSDTSHDRSPAASTARCWSCARPWMTSHASAGPRGASSPVHGPERPGDGRRARGDGSHLPRPRTVDRRDPGRR
jgi:hypothetical protein